MSLADVTVWFDSPFVRIVGIDCRHPRGGCGCERGGERTHLALLRRGGFGYHLRGADYIGDPATALLYRAGDAYRISHPLDGGDACTCFEVAPEHEEELFGQRLRDDDAARAVDPDAQFRHRMLHAALVRGERGRLVTEERAATLCQGILHCGQAGGSVPVRSPAALRLARRARVALLADPTADAGLAALASLAGCSPFHLARVFRRAYGMSLTDCRTRLRLALALERLGDADDLAALACDLGFSHHSHFGAAFRRHVGLTPVAARTALRGAARARLRRDLIAATPAGR